MEEDPINRNPQVRLESGEERLENGVGLTNTNFSLSLLISSLRLSGTSYLIESKLQRMTITGCFLSNLVFLQL